MSEPFILFITNMVFLVSFLSSWNLKSLRAFVWFGITITSHTLCYSSAGSLVCRDFAQAQIRPYITNAIRQCRQIELSDHVFFGPEINVNFCAILAVLLQTVSSWHCFAILINDAVSACWWFHIRISFVHLLFFKDYSELFLICGFEFFCGKSHFVIEISMSIYLALFVKTILLIAWCSVLAHLALIQLLTA